MTRFRIPGFAALLVAVVFSMSAAPLRSAPEAVVAGSIIGRVLNASNGSYLNQARVSIQGTNLEAFTDSAGFYRLDGVPAGTVVVRVFYTGFVPLDRTAVVAAGRATRLDLDVGVGGTGAATENVVKLDEYVIEAHKDIDQKSIAINEQRFATNLKSVVSADQFGDVTEGNIGEFLKYMPGVSLEYTAADTRQIILRGVNPIYTSVSIDGNRVASAASSAPNRFFELEQSSINNVSRVEVIFSRTPDQPADALGGAVNLISKSAFESDRASLGYRAYISINSEAAHLGRTPGPNEDYSRKIKPGFDLSLIEPVNARFGFTVNVLDSTIFNVQHQTQPTWTPIVGGAGGTVSNPFMKTYQLMDSPKTTERRSVGVTLDFKPSDSDTFSFRPQWNNYNAFFASRDLNWNVQGTSNTAPVSWGPDYVAGAAGAGSAFYNSSFRHKFGTTYQIDTRYLHHGQTWTIDGGTSFSNATNHYHDHQEGHFEGLTLTRYGLTDTFSGITANDSQIKPSLITTTDGRNGGQPFDWTNPNGYYITGATFNPQDSVDRVKNVHLGLSRPVWDVLPTTIKFGGVLEDHVRDIRQPQTSLTFVGPNNKATTGNVTDAGDLASNYNIVDRVYTVAPPFNFPSITWPSNYALYNLYLAHPEYFTYNAANIATAVKNSRYINELVSAAYLMGDTRAFGGRLRLVYGVRYERTLDSAWGFLQDVDAIYQHDSAGNLLKGANGKPLPVTGPNGLPITDPSNAVALNQMEYRDRGLHNTKQYATGYPSVSVAYNVTPDLILRASYARALGRPDFANIIPGVNLPDPSATNQTIAVNNSSLEPELANNYDAALEYYFSSVGSVGVSFYRKDFSNFFGTFTLPATAQLLDQYGVPNPELYLADNDFIQTKFNVGTARVTGIQLDYKQALTFLPVPGFGVFASGYSTHLTGSPLADFSNFISKAFNAGVSYDRERFGVKFNFNYRGTQRYGLTQYKDSAGTKINGYQYYKPRAQFDIDLNYRVTRHVGLFVAGRNITNVPQDQQRYAPEMPGYSHLFQRADYGTQYTAGIKGAF